MQISNNHFYLNQIKLVKQENNNSKSNPILKQEIAFNGLPSWKEIKTRAYEVLHPIKPVVYNSKNFSAPKNTQELEEKINSWEINYNPLAPGINYEVVTKMQRAGENVEEFIKQIDNVKYHYDIDDEHVPTQNRADIPVFSAPIFNPSVDFNYECNIPVGEKLDIVKTEPKKVHAHSEKTVIETDYSSSVQWDSDKIARDLMQNFFDGHNQTLDGVKIKIDRLGERKNEQPVYKVRIEGLSTFDPDKAILFGETTKKDNLKAAGNFGEGIKMTILKLLSEYDVDYCDIGSNNWNVRWRKDISNINDKEVLAYDLEEKEQFNGSYFEFKTTNLEILNSITKTVGRFYHSGNPHFKSPDFENEHFGFKLLPEDEKGAIYIAGMQFECDEEYDNVPNFVLFIKEKLPLKVFNPTRDRHSISKYDYEKFGKHLAEISSVEDYPDIINAMRPYWEAEKNSMDETHVKKFLLGVVNQGYYKNIKIKFPEYYLAVESSSDLSDNGTKVLEKLGNTICNYQFGRIGMKKVNQRTLEMGAYKPIKPNEIQTKKIAILKEALLTFKDVLRTEFTPFEIDTRIFLFEPKDLTAGESIVIGGKCFGMWINERILKNSDFGELFGTVIHELCHKAGEDGAEAFSYKLTDVMKKMFNAISINPEIAQKMHDLSNMWDELE